MSLEEGKKREERSPRTDPHGIIVEVVETENLTPEMADKKTGHVYIYIARFN